MSSSLAEDIQWVDKNYADLHRKYAGKYIVVKNNKVIIVADDFETADARAKEMLGSAEYTVERIEIGGLFAYSFEISP